MNRPPQDQSFDDEQAQVCLPGLPTRFAPFQYARLSFDYRRIRPRRPFGSTSTIVAAHRPNKDIVRFNPQRTHDRCGAATKSSCSSAHAADRACSSMPI